MRTDADNVKRMAISKAEFGFSHFIVAGKLNSVDMSECWCEIVSACYLYLYNALG